MLPGPMTTQAVINPGPILIYQGRDTVGSFISQSIRLSFRGLNSPSSNLRIGTSLPPLRLADGENLGSIP